MRLPIFAVLFLSACGVTDVATTAAQSAKLQAEQAKQGKESMEKVQADINAAMKANETRAAKADPQQ